LRLLSRDKENKRLHQEGEKVRISRLRRPSPPPRQKGRGEKKNPYRRREKSLELHATSVLILTDGKKNEKKKEKKGGEKTRARPLTAIPTISRCRREKEKEKRTRERKEARSEPEHRDLFATSRAAKGERKKKVHLEGKREKGTSRSRRLVKGCGGRRKGERHRRGRGG